MLALYYNKGLVDFYLVLYMSVIHIVFGNYNNKTKENINTILLHLIIS